MSDTPKQDFYARSLVEQLSDLVDTLNEARADGSRFNFRIVEQGDKSPWVGVGPTFHGKNVRHHAASSSSKALACFRSNVSKPSVNQP
jgi:hypothetical protein